jgi:hypothetical protein
MTTNEADQQLRESQQRMDKKWQTYRDQEVKRLHAFDEPFPDEIAFYAFRYALGRMTYAVKTVTDYRIEHIDELSERSRALMVKEITDADRDDALGMECDKEAWLALREKLEARC